MHRRSPGPHPGSADDQARQSLHWWRELLYVGVFYLLYSGTRNLFGSAGGGSITHLAGELLKSEARIDLVHVPYKGAAPAVSDLVGGQVQMGIFDVPILLGHIRSGKLKALAVTSTARAPTLPDVPTTAELNYPHVTSDNWYGLVVPAATPADIQKRLNSAAVAALRSPVVAEQFAKVGGLASPSTPQEYAAFLAKEQEKWSRVVSAIGFKEQTQ